MLFKSQQPEKIAELLLANLPRDLILAVEEELPAAAVRAFEGAKDLHIGHRASGLGQLRHLRMNEAFGEVLANQGANPTPIRGNSVVVGRAGIFLLSRFNLSSGIWNHSRRSKTRVEMAAANLAVEQLIYPDLFETVPITQATAFFVASFSGSLDHHPQAPLSMSIAVPDQELRSWLFRESLVDFRARYDATPVQVDEAKPMLKHSIVTGRDKKAHE